MYAVVRGLTAMSLITVRISVNIPLTKEGACMLVDVAARISTIFFADPRRKDESDSERSDRKWSAQTVRYMPRMTKGSEAKASLWKRATDVVRSDETFYN